MLLEELDSLGVSAWVPDSTPPLNPTPEGDPLWLTQQVGPPGPTVLCLESKNHGGQEQPAFEGASEELLTKMLVAGMKLSLEEVGRARLTDVSQGTAPTIRTSWNAHPPQLLLAFGPEVAQRLLATNSPFEELRGQIFSTEYGVPLLATHHPEQLLNEPGLKADTWADLQVAMKHLGLPSA